VYVSSVTTNKVFQSVLVFLVLRKNVSRPRAHSQLTDVETSEMRKDVFHVLQNQTKTKKKPSRNQRAPINERRLRSAW